LSSEILIDEKDIEFFSTIMCSPSSMQSMSACVFNPGFALEFTYENESFYALICYSCRDLRVTNSEGETLTGWGMSKLASLGFIGKFYEYYPEDNAVQDIRISSSSH
jgi:hypothetical protein